MSAERDKVAAREILARVEYDYDLNLRDGPDYINARDIEAAIVEALASARRLGAEEMRERCAEACEETGESFAEEPNSIPEEWVSEKRGARLCASAIRSLPLPPEVSA
jgi:hypothetical protein